MKVHELINQLEKFPAGAEVFVFVPGTMHARAGYAARFDENEVVIEADDAELVDDEGECVAMTSEAGEMLRDCNSDGGP